MTLVATPAELGVAQSGEPELAETVGSPSPRESQISSSDVPTMLTQITGIIRSELCPFSAVVTDSGFAQGGTSIQLDAITTGN